MPRAFVFKTSCGLYAAHVVPVNSIASGVHRVEMKYGTVEFVRISSVIPMSFFQQARRIMGSKSYTYPDILCERIRNIKN